MRDARVSLYSGLSTKWQAAASRFKDFLKKEEYKAQFEEIEQMLFVNIEGRRVIICHYPMIEWNGLQKETWHVHGHIHNRHDYTYDCLKGVERALNAGVDICQYIPVTLSELIKYNKAWKDQSNK